MGVMENGSEGPDIELFRDSARKFFQNEIRPHGERWRKAGVVDREAFLKAGEMGFLCMWADEKYGGQNLRGFRYEQTLIEENTFHGDPGFFMRSEEHTSELQSLMRISYAVFCLKKKK